MTPMTGVLQREEEEEIHIEEGVVEELLHYPVIAVITVINTIKYLKPHTTISSHYLNTNSRSVTK